MKRERGKREGEREIRWTTPEKCRIMRIDESREYRKDRQSKRETMMKSKSENRKIDG